MDKKLQPNSTHCFVCGLKNPFGLKLRFYLQGSSEVIASYTVPEQYQGYPGVVHGGIVAAMLDEAAGRSLMSLEGGTGMLDPRFMVTVRLDIRYRKNVPVGCPLTLVGRAGRSKGRTAQAKSYLYDETGSLLAEADALLMDVPDDILAGVNLEELGWKVYPEGEIVQ